MWGNTLLDSTPALNWNNASQVPVNNNNNNYGSGLELDWLDELESILCNKPFELQSNEPDENEVTTTITRTIITTTRTKKVNTNNNNNRPTYFEYRVPEYIPLPPELSQFQRKPSINTATDVNANTICSAPSPPCAPYASELQNHYNSSFKYGGYYPVASNLEPVQLNYPEDKTLAGILKQYDYNNQHSEPIGCNRFEDNYAPAGIVKKYERVEDDPYWLPDPTTQIYDPPSSTVRPYQQHQGRQQVKRGRKPRDFIVNTDMYLFPMDVIARLHGFTKGIMSKYNTIHKRGTATGDKTHSWPTRGIKLQLNKLQKHLDSIPEYSHIKSAATQLYDAISRPVRYQLSIIGGLEGLGGEMKRRKQLLNIIETLALIVEDATIKNIVNELLARCE